MHTKLSMRARLPEAARTNASYRLLVARQRPISSLFAGSTRTLTLLRHRPREFGANNFQVYFRQSVPSNNIPSLIAYLAANDNGNGNEPTSRRMLKPAT